MDLSVKVRNVRQEALEVKSFELVNVDGTPLPSFTAGSHIDVQMAPNLTRQYSLCNAPSDTAR
jgi:vanillate O-demethylase ferredoxin subunit